MNVPSFDEFIESIFIDQMAEVVSEVDSQEVDEDEPFLFAM